MEPDVSCALGQHDLVQPRGGPFMQRAVMARLPQGQHTVIRPTLPPDACPGNQSPSLGLEGPKVQDAWERKPQFLTLA